MPSLLRLRHDLLRSTWSHGLGLWLILGLLVSSWTRWEVHSHPVAEHGHTHQVVLAEHGEPALPSGGDASAAVPHVHDLAPSSAALAASDHTRLMLVWPDRWLPSRPTMPAPSNAGPPPHRPPIA